MKRTILHVDMDAFYASVEQLDHPEWRGRPVIVGAPPDQRGVVAAASYEARAFGVHSAMPSREAGRRCPDAIFAPVNMARYSEMSRRVVAIYERFTPLVEPVSIDEAFLDVTGSQRLFGSGPDIAGRIKRTIREETGLTASVGVASNKFLAKLASDLEKPDGLTVVPDGREAIAAFLAPLPVKRIWGVGHVTAGELERLGVHTVAELQALPEDRFASSVGRHTARHLLRLAWGDDARELELEHDEKSISREHTFLEDCRDARVLECTLGDLADDVGRRLRASGNYAATAHLKLRWQDFRTLTRQRMLSPPCCDDFSLRRAAFDLFEREERPQPVRLIGFGVSGLRATRNEQLDLFDSTAPTRERREELSYAVDRIRSQFGPDAIRRARSRGSGKSASD